MAIRIQLRRDTAQNWFNNNPSLLAGEIGFEIDTKKFKIGPLAATPGQGTPWNSITSYANVVPSDLDNTLEDYVLVADVGAPSGIAQLDSSGYVPLAQLPPTAKISVTSVADQAARLLLTAETGDVAIQTDTGTTYVLSQSPASTNTNWKEITATKAIQDAVNAAVSGLVDGAPNLLNTLNELAAAINDDPTFFTTIATNLSNHEADTTNVHGIVDTAALATKTYADSAVTTHNNDVTDVHGIADTGELATKTFAANLLTGATKSNITITGDKNGLTITAENGVADSTTTDLVEGTNLYFTNERAQDAVGNSIGNGLDYDDATGAISVDPSEFTLNSIAVPTADVSMATYKITNLGAPESSSDAATKAYVDSVTEGLHIHESVRAFYAANVDLATEVRVGDIIDGVTLAAGHRVLLNGQTLERENGIYVVSVSGAPTRALDFDTSAEVDSGDFVFVSNGLTYGGTGWVQTSRPLTIGSDPINFTQFAGAGTYTDGNGLNLNGTVFSIDTAVTVDVNTAQTLTNKALGTGSSLSASLDANQNKIIDLAEPTSNSDAATKLYADTVAGAAEANAESYVDTAISNLIQGAPTALDTLNELAAALNDDASFATTVTNQFTTIDNTVSAHTTANSAHGVTSPSIIVGTQEVQTLENKTIDGVLNTFTNIPQSAVVDLVGDLDLLAPKDAATFTGNTVLPATTSIGDVSSVEIGYVNGVTSPIQTQIDGKAPSTDATFTGSILLPSTTSIGNVTSDEIAYLDGVTGGIQGQFTALSTVVDTKAELTDVNTRLAPKADPTFTGTVVLPSTTSIGDVSGTEISFLNNVSSSIQTQLDAKAPSAGPTFTGTVTLPSTTIIGDVEGTELQYINGVTSNIQTQLDDKAPIDSPTFTGTVAGITKDMVGLANVENTSDANKPVSSATSTALGLKANLAGPTFTGSVILPTTTAIGSVTSDEIGYLDGVTSAIQTQINNRLTTAAASTTYATLASPTFTGTVVLPSTTSIGTLTSAEIARVAGVTSPIQTQLSALAPKASPTFTGTVTFPAGTSGANFTGIPNSATTATNLNTASTIIARDANGNFTAGNITANLIGNASTADKLSTARSINGTSFDGSADVTVASAAGTLTGNTLASNVTASSLTSFGTVESITTSGNVIVGGNLTVIGSTTNASQASLEVTATTIIVAEGATSAAAANNAGLTVDGPADAKLFYTAGDDRWNFNKGLNATVYGTGANLTNIPNSALTNSSISINGTPYALGSNIAINVLSSYTNNEGKILTTNGTSNSWTTTIPTLEITGTATVPTPKNDRQILSEFSRAPLPAENALAANKTYVDSEIAYYLSGGFPDIIPVDQIQDQLDGTERRFILQFNGELIPVANPLRLLIAVNGIIQSVGYPEYVFMSFLPETHGFWIDNEGYVVFTETPPAGSTFDGRVISGPTVNTKEKKYPFRGIDILMGE